MPTSEFTGEQLDGASEAWRHECECRWLLDGIAAGADPDERRRARREYLWGVPTDYDPKKVKRRGVAQVRGEEAAKLLEDDTMRLYELRRTRQAALPAPAEEAA